MAAELITIEEYCLHHHTEHSFIDALEQNGLIQVTLLQQQRYIDYGQLRELECYTRWFYDLDINVEGIEVVQQLLQKVEQQQHYIQELEARLRGEEHAADPYADL